MKLGCCVSMTATTSTGIGNENIPLFQELGYDYIELPLAQVMDLSDKEFSGLLGRIEGIPVEACNNFFPPSIRLTGPEADKEAILDYVSRAVDRASKLGAKIIVLGSAGAKNIPEGFPYEKAREQFIGLLRDIHKIVAPLGITVVLEPLNTKESNFITSAKVALAIMKDVDCDNIKLLVDFYHMRMEDEGLEVIREAGSHLCHVHIAAKDKRLFPREGDGEDYKSFFETLRSAGYDGRISVEGKPHDLTEDARASASVLKPYTDTVLYIENKAKRLRNLVLQMIGIGKAGHIGGSNSAADFVAALYFAKMRLNPKDPKCPDRDRFILSKGHAALIQYAALAELGYFPMEELAKTKSFGSMLQGHPDINKTPGIDANTGSLGQGLSIACGMAVGLKMDGKSNKVYVVIGDGELAEGQIWEAAMMASVYKLDNLVAILDKNNIQAMGTIEERFNIHSIPEKWRAFGWEVLEIDGHNVSEILDAFNKTDEVKSKPSMIIAHTVKGKGVDFAENTALFHNGILTEEQYNSAIRQLT